MYTGNCLCGAISFTITAELEAVQICHCSQCRKAQGTPFASNIPVNEADLVLNSGREQIRSFESSPGKERCFCETCGSPVFSRLATLPGVVRVRAGLINEPLRTGPIAHFYVGSKCNWWSISDDLPQFKSTPK
jgi:hypothetical protein